MTFYSFFRYFLLGLLVLILGGLGGWFFYLRVQKAALTTADAGRGFGAETPSFGGDIGSSHTNALTSLPVASSSAPSSSDGGKDVWHVDKAPVAGFGFIAATASSTGLYFIERATGYIYEARPDEGRVQRMTSTLTPKVYEAYVAYDGSVLERTLNDAGDLTTTLLTASSGSASGVRRVVLPNNISPISAYAGGSLSYGTSNGSLWSLWTSAWDASHAKVVFSSPIAHWRLTALDSDRLVLAEQAASGVVGHAYELSKKGTLTPIAPPLPGLMVAPQASSSAVLFSSSIDDAAQLFVSSTAHSSPVRIGLSTIAEKCVWGNLGSSPIKKGIAATSSAFCASPDQIPKQYINAWYRGEAHTTDSWWKIDIESGNTQKLDLDFSPESAPDVLDPQMSPSGTYIAFKDARDQSLWIIKVPR